MDSQQQQPQPQYVISPTTHHAAHPDDIIASCHALQDHLKKLESDAKTLVAKWQGDIHDRDLAEKRRVAPGWLDVDEGNRLLMPERKPEPAGDLMTGIQEGPDGSDGLQAVVGGVQRLELEGSASREGEELDRAFGGPT